MVKQTGALTTAAIGAALAIIATGALVTRQNPSTYNGTGIQNQQSWLRSRGCLGAIDPTLLLYYPLTRKTDQAYDCSSAALNSPFKGNAPLNFLPGKTGPWTYWCNKSNGNYIGVSTITLPSAWTVNAWVKPGTLTGGYGRIAEMNFSTGLYLGTDSTMGQWQLIINDSSLSHACKGGTTNTGGTTWAMVTGVWDGTYGYLYQNGSLVIGGSAAGSACSFTAPTTGVTNSLRIGCYNSGSSCSSANSAWDGAIQEFRIYSRALAAPEIAALYAAQNH